MRVKTPARISKAARSAATTAQLSSDNNQLLREFMDTALVLIILSFSFSAHCGAVCLMPLHVAAPKRLADFLDPLRLYPANNHQRRRTKLLFVRHLPARRPPALFLRSP